MKKIFLIVCLTTLWSSYSQEMEKSIYERKTEIKVGAVKLLAGPIFEGTFEYIKTKNFTYGGSLLINLTKNSGFGEDFSITPFTRFYFQETKEYGAKGFFVEAFGKFISGKNLISNNSNYEKFNAGAIGLSLGKKWINSSGFVFEILGGAGRTIGGGVNTPDAVFRGDLNIGYRF